MAVVLREAARSVDGYVAGEYAAAMSRWLAVAIAAACGSKSPEAPPKEPKHERQAPAAGEPGSASAQPSSSMPLVAADVAPCELAGSGNPNSMTTPHDPPKAQSFQGVTCGTEPTDVQLFDFADADEAAWQASLVRKHLGGESDGPSYSPFVMMARGNRLAILGSPRPSQLVGILRDRGFVDITRAPTTPLAEPTAADLQRWKTLLACQEHAYYCKALDEFGRGTRPKPTAGTRTGVAFVATPEPTPESEHVGYLRTTDTEVGFGRIESFDDDQLRLSANIWISRLRGTGDLRDKALAPIQRRATELGARPGHAAHVLATSLAYDDGGTHVFVRETTTGYVAIEKPTRGAVIVAVFPR